MERWANGLGAVEKSSEPRRAHCEPVVAPQHHSEEEEVGINCNDIAPQRSCKLDAAILHVIGFLGEALARMTAIQAMEEYGVSQYASSIQFINKLITAARSPVQPCTVDESTPDICSTIEVSTEETDGQSVDADLSSADVSLYHTTPGAPYQELNLFSTPRPGDRRGDQFLDGREYT
ncbi:unnamed protein product [Sphagnum jensenii]|uniref:Uncharacterized protein n=1 Tax=Sphagnum jensenii TaxID=128206 RepID=A0ABP0WTA8_9BRYO